MLLVTTLVGCTGAPRASDSASTTDLAEQCVGEVGPAPADPCDPEENGTSTIPTAVCSYRDEAGCLAELDICWTDELPVERDDTLEEHREWYLDSVWTCCTIDGATYHHEQRPLYTGWARDYYFDQSGTMVAVHEQGATVATTYCCGSVYGQVQTGDLWRGAWLRGCE